MELWTLRKSMVCPDLRRCLALLVCGDDVHLDAVERALVQLKRRRVISGRKMAVLHARHLLET